MIERSQHQHYQVPRRFSVRTLLVVTALFAAMLSLFKWTDTSPLVLVFYSSFVIVVGAAQVLLERSPRLASIVAGAIFLPILKLIAVAVEDGLTAVNTGPFTGLFTNGQIVYLFLFGALYGYLSGTMLAGLYLVSDHIQRLFLWQKQSQLPTKASS